MIIDEFTVRSRVQKEWGWLIVVAFFCGGAGAGAFLVSWSLGITPGLTLGILLVTVGANGALLLDLGRIDRFWRVFSHPSTSWISRGSFLIAAFTVLGVLYVLPQFAWFAWLPWSASTGLGRSLGFLAAAMAVGVSIYSGFVMSYSSGIPFWNTTLLPVLFALYAIGSGTATVLALLPGAVGAAGALVAMEALVAILLATSLGLLGVYITMMLQSPHAAREAAAMLVKGPLAPVFLGGVVLLGLILPLVVVVLSYPISGNVPPPSPALVGAAALEWVGGLLMRYCFVRAGTYGAVGST